MPLRTQDLGEIVAQLRQMDVALAQGTPPAEATLGIGVGEMTYHRWRNE